jgi:FkbM family methyltransferase
MNALPFKMYVENKLEKWRHDSFWVKEPETIEWLKTFSSFYSDNLVDIGANIGVYSLFYAAHGSRVIAIEPFRKNFDRLCDNIKLNGFEHISPMNIAIGAENYIEYLKPVSNEIGSSGHQLSEAEGEECFVLTLDTLYHMAKSFFFPINHIKIDTDGNEYDIIKGGKDTLASKDLRSVLIEVNDHKEEIIEIFKQNGFTTDNIFNTMTPHSRERRAKEGITAENIIFTR